MIIEKTHTLIDGINAAKKANYVEEFVYTGKKISGRNNEQNYTKNQCQLDEYARYEGMSDPSDASMLFLISCTDGTKGLLSSGYGNDADTELIEFVLALDKK